MSQMNISWLGHDAFRLEGRGKVAYIDPYKLARPERDAALILVTHHHSDHFDLQTISRLSREGTVIVGPRRVARKLPGCIEVEPGDEHDLAGVKVRVMPAYNVNKFRSRGQSFHPRGLDVGYIVEMDGQTVYHAGDSDLIPEMQGLEPDVALVPVSGRWVMTADEAAEAVAVMRAKRAIPMHYGAIVGSLADAQRFAKLAGARVEILSKAT